ncbi:MULTISPECIES: DUF2249 domain-containing protein [unclassified Meiothermus]|uniref:DUF2249 domain-containing protein n=1 Tax=unclassified Meiothermus TaxID=370471 RepID=UPI000D7BF3FA|nr:MULTISPECIES: DUF2249 domain-containing protein [unclassified Meiothermus]PZA06225.1 hypothetical protein DNA98_14620 [Meiothermus sp. Pnk-1]RYM37515.1 DUF2249 domain-containing protein [Meiothermus sp. PNK-Is4]
MRVSQLLDEHPELLEVLIEASPAFAKLKNPLLRRTMPRLVTLAQAARIGGLEPAVLVERLNRALGVQTPRAEEASAGNESKLGTPPPDWLAAPVGFHLDVRPILAAGGEPFGAIMAAAREVAPGQRLCLEVPFEPLPLYRVMERKGFEAWCEQEGPEHYRVHFLRLGPGAEERVARTLSEADWAVYAAEVTIETNLEPPLPMMRVLEALARLEPGQRLLVHHVRRPVHLLARLEQDGHPYALRDLGPGRVELLIEKAS